MKVVYKVNNSWGLEQVIKITALYSVMYDWFENHIKKVYGNKIKYQFLFSSNRFHRDYNIYKKQFSILLDSKSIKAIKDLRKITPSNKKFVFKIEGTKCIELDHRDDIYYNPIEDVDDLRYSIAYIDQRNEETCVLCNMAFKDIDKHYDGEIGLEKEY